MNAKNSRENAQVCFMEAFLFLHPVDFIND